MRTLTAQPRPGFTYPSGSEGLAPRVGRRVGAARAVLDGERRTGLPGTWRPPQHPTLNIQHPTFNAGAPRAGRGHSLRAHSLVELMFSILILGVGLTGVASLFPVAGKLQQNTYEDALLLEVKANVRSLILGRGFSQVDLANLAQPDLAGFTVGRVVPMPPSVLNGAPNLPVPLPQPLPQSALQRVWDWRARTYPCLPSPVGTIYYWVPLMKRDINAPNWTVHAFIVKPEEGVSYSTKPQRLISANPDDGPQIPAIRWVGATTSKVNANVLTIADRSVVQEGDWVLDDAGGIHKVLAVTGPFTIRLDSMADPTVTKLWYAERVGSSPTRAIISVPNPVI